MASQPALQRHHRPTDRAAVPAPWAVPRRVTNERVFTRRHLPLYVALSVVNLFAAASLILFWLSKAEWSAQTPAYVVLDRLAADRPLHVRVALVRAPAHAAAAADGGPTGAAGRGRHDLRPRRRGARDARADGPGARRDGLPARDLGAGRGRRRRRAGDVPAARGPALQPLGRGALPAARRDLRGPHEARQLQRVARRRRLRPLRGRLRLRPRSRPRAPLPRPASWATSTIPRSATSRRRSSTTTRAPASSPGARPRRPTRTTPRSR